jgi:hypothetical protein
MCLFFKKQMLNFGGSDGAISKHIKDIVLTLLNPQVYRMRKTDAIV